MLWVRPTSLDNTLPLRSVVFTPKGPPSEKSLQPGGSLLQETSETLTLGQTRHFTFPSARGAPAIPPLVHAQPACQRLPVTHGAWMGLDRALPQGPSHVRHLLGMPRAWQDPKPLPAEVLVPL